MYKKWIQTNFVRWMDSGVSSLYSDIRKEKGKDRTHHSVDTGGGEEPETSDESPQESGRGVDGEEAGHVKGILDGE